MKPLALEERAARRRAWLELQAQLAQLDARLARIDCSIGALEAKQRQRRRAQAQAARAAAAARQREYESTQATRQQRMAGGLATAFVLGARAVVAGASMRHPMGLRELD
ncbi:hypothetical protein [Variovorax sp. EL159]|uniref:hypothetical protein n=1 Tax=Variovorax sp. EL159 TaxID=1566270 RepID=UPI00088E03FB|nr:hypothetical protein [Variovorax sp. EL159]SCX72638.1 hypothetical protein SAMN03159363_4360 [Variovorax sp. EL159]